MTSQEITQASTARALQMVEQAITHAEGALGRAEDNAQANSLHIAEYLVAYAQVLATVALTKAVQELETTVRRGFGVLDATIARGLS